MKGRDKRGREEKKKRKPKKQPIDLGVAGVPFRHHEVPPAPASAPPAPARPEE